MTRPMPDLRAAAWEISWPEINAPLGLSVAYSGHNSVADYRAAVHADATSRPMVYEDEAMAEIDRLQAEAAKKCQWPDCNCSNDMSTKRVHCERLPILIVEPSDAERSTT